MTLVGNKCDLEAKREVSAHDGELLAKVFVSFLTSSAAVKYFVMSFSSYFYNFIFYSHMCFSYGMLMLMPRVPMRTEPFCGCPFGCCGFCVPQGAKSSRMCRRITFRSWRRAPSLARMSAWFSATLQSEFSHRQLYFTINSV